MTRKMITTSSPPAPATDKPLPRLRLLNDERSQRPVLRFAPTAWAKLQFFRDRGETEIGGFGVTAPNDLLLIEQFVTVRQAASWVSIAFDDAAVADFFDAVTSLRPPRPAKNIEDGIKMVEELSGDKLDRSMVKLLLEMHKDKLEN